MLAKEITPDVIEEFLRLVKRLPKGNACVLWKGKTFGEGYGCFLVPSKGMYITHRVAFFIRYGSIDRTKEVHHTCRNEGCYNPKHLEQVGTREHRLKHPADHDRLSQSQQHRWADPGQKAWLAKRTRDANGRFTKQ